MKIYIAGKIAGDPNYKEKFFEAAHYIEEQGHVPLNPAVLPLGLEPADYMRICLAMLDSADEIYLLPGWMDSKGATIEDLLAHYVGKSGSLFIGESQIRRVFCEAKP